MKERTKIVDSEIMFNMERGNDGFNSSKKRDGGLIVE
jgi:hypothetical protein